MLNTASAEGLNQLTHHVTILNEMVCFILTLYMTLMYIHSCSGLQLHVHVFTVFLQRKGGSEEEEGSDEGVSLYAVYI